MYFKKLASSKIATHYQLVFNADGVERVNELLIQDRFIYPEDVMMRSSFLKSHTTYWRSIRENYKTRSRTSTQSLPTSLANFYSETGIYSS